MSDEESVMWWIMDPQGHRVIENAAKAEWLASDADETFLGMKVAKIATPDAPPDMWVCDFCNDDITIVHPFAGYPVMVPMYDSNALCQSCMVKYVLSRPKHRAKYDVFMNEGLPTEFWSAKFCSCEACVERMRQILGPVFDEMEKETYGQDG